jgi:hypothetical protein
MLTALILICSVATTPDIRDCSRDNATTVMRVPVDFANPLTCFMHAQAYLAETSIGRAVSEDDLVRVMCAPTKTVGASIPTLSSD